MSEEIGKWEGFSIWDTSTHAQPLADRPAQQIKADLTFNLRMKVHLTHMPHNACTKTDITVAMISIITCNVQVLHALLVCRTADILPLHRP